jgi:hypothetical protein
MNMKFMTAENRRSDFNFKKEATDVKQRMRLLEEERKALSTKRRDPLTYSLIDDEGVAYEVPIQVVSNIRNLKYAFGFKNEFQTSLATCHPLTQDERLYGRRCRSHTYLKIAPVHNFEVSQLKSP